MKSCEYNYNDLSRKYQNFILPYVSIKINGKKVKTLLATENKKDTSLNISYVRVNLSIENSSMAQIRVLDTYNYSNSSINQVVTLGSLIRNFGIKYRMMLMIKTHLRYFLDISLELIINLVATLEY